MGLLATKFDPDSLEARENSARMVELCDGLKKRHGEALFQGAEKYLERNKKRGKLTARERVELLLDLGSPFLELMSLAGYGLEGQSVGGSIVAGIGSVSGVECLVNANVQTLKGGALGPLSVKKMARLDDIARENRLPTIYLNESAGADLPQQADIFNQGGRAFREITRRSRMGIPSITAVFGSSTAGGAYIPGMSDYVIMVKGKARAYLAGPPLVKMAVGEDVEDEELGGAEMHARTSGLADFLAEDDRDALRLVREVVANLNWRKARPFPPGPVDEPLYRAEDLLGIVPADVRIPFDPREVIARLVDGSCFFEFRPLIGETLVTGFARVFACEVGILANHGALTSEAANKGHQFIQLCNRQDRPLVFLQNITGFMVGREAEQGGIIKHGAKLINAVSNSTVPAFTFIIGSSYGAGNYGMCGRAYAPRFLFAWPNARLAVMGPDQLVGTLEIVQNMKRARDGGGSLDRAKGEVVREALRKRIDRESDAMFATARLWDDGIVDPRETRTVLGLCLSAVHNAPFEGTGEFGVLRT